MWITTILLVWRSVARAEDCLSDNLCSWCQLNAGTPSEHLPGLQNVNPFWSQHGHKCIWFSNLWDSWENTDFPAVPPSVSVFFLCLIDFLLSNWYIEREESLVYCLPFSTVNFVSSFHECSKGCLLVKPQCVSPWSQFCCWPSWGTAWGHRDLRGGWWYFSVLPKHLSFFLCKDFSFETSKMNWKMRLNV